MQLDDLRYFSNVALSGSFSKGAALSHISPPAVSKAVRRLETELETALFTRTTRRVALTESGELLLRRCQKIFGELDALRADLDAGTAQVRGDIRIGAMEVFSIHLLPHAISELVGEHPELRPETYEMIPQRMEDLLLQGRIDVGVTIGGSDVRGIRYHPLGTSKSVLVCGQTHPLHREGRVSKTKLRDHPFVVPKFLGMEHLPVLDEFPEDRYPRRVGATIELLQMGAQLVIGGRYLGYFPEVAVRDHIESGRLKVLLGLRHKAKFNLLAITREGAPIKPAVRLLMDRLRESVSNESMSVY